MLDHPTLLFGAFIVLGTLGVATYLTVVASAQLATSTVAPCVRAQRLAQALDRTAVLGASSVMRETYVHAVKTFAIRADAMDAQCAAYVEAVATQCGTDGSRAASTTNDRPWTRLDCDASVVLAVDLLLLTRVDGVRTLHQSSQMDAVLTDCGVPASVRERAEEIVAHVINDLDHRENLFR